MSKQTKSKGIKMQVTNILISLLFLIQQQKKREKLKRTNKRIVKCTSHNAIEKKNNNKATTMRKFYTYKHTNILADDKYTKIYIFCKHEDVKKKFKTTKPVQLV